MKRSRNFSLMILGLALLVVASGCKHKAVDVTQFPGRNTKVTPTLNNGNTTDSTPKFPVDDTVRGGNIPTGEPTPQRGGLLNMPHTENRELLKAETIYFDLDSATVKSSEKSKLEAAAKYLQSNSHDEILVEGHCDERGTEDYNLSLGERRALAIREGLIALGASGDKVHTISYGESRPADTGHDDSAWKRNRRGDFVVLQPQ
ncbi:MAG: hypothetical protein JWM68_4625 [Verrucomicrobiales bacterium]|nr:hypothetical protein [Verrucomicrobiales bacterium]